MLNKLLKNTNPLLTGQKPENGVSQLGHPATAGQPAFDQLLASRIGSSAVFQSGLTLVRPEASNSLGFLHEIGQSREGASRNLGLTASSSPDRPANSNGDAPAGQTLRLADDVKLLDSIVVGYRKRIQKKPTKSLALESIGSAVNRGSEADRAQPAGLKTANSSGIKLTAPNEKASAPSESMEVKYLVRAAANRNPQETLTPLSASVKPESLLLEQSERAGRKVEFSMQAEPERLNPASPLRKDYAPRPANGNIAVSGTRVKKIEASVANEAVQTQATKIQVETLGKISIKPQVIDGYVRLEVGVQTEAAKQWLQDRLQALGFDRSKIEISVREQGTDERLASTKGQGAPRLGPSQAMDRIQEINQAARRSAVRMMESPQHELSRSVQEGTDRAARPNQLHVEVETANKSAQPSMLPLQNQSARFSSGRVSAGRSGMPHNNDSPVKRAGQSHMKSDSDPPASAVPHKHDSVDEPAKRRGPDQKSGEMELDGFVKSMSNSGSNRGDSSLTSFGSSARTGANTTLNSSGQLTGQTVEQSQLPRMIQKIVDIANSQSSLSSRKLEVQMKVEKLGNLLVDAVKQQDKIHLQISVESNEVRRLIEAQIRPLVDQMVKDGIEIGKLEVSLKHSKDHEQEGDLTRHDTNNFSDRRRQQARHDWEFQEKQNSGHAMTRDFGYNSLEVWA